MKGIVAALTGLAIFALVVLAVLLVRPQASPHGTPAGAAAPARLPGASVDSTDFDTYAEQGRKLKNTPASWRGTKPDGDLREDAKHNLIVDDGVRRRFEYFLSALGEDDLNVIRARLAAHLQAALSPKAAVQAWRLFQQYLGYREALRDLSSHGDSVEGLRATLGERQALRQRWFDAPTTEAFFGFQDRYARFALDRRAILENDQLSSAEKQTRLSDLEAQLPDHLRKLVTASRKPASVARHVAAMRADQVSEARIYQYRQQQLGEAAAQRLQNLDQQRNQWQQRYQDYRQQRQAIIDSGLAREDREAEIRRLRERLFSNNGQRRVRALDRIQARGDGDQLDAPPP